ncbi:M54 protein [Murid betaherpesvirus 1]|uniref:DNA polymerase n=1 Tax=Murid herpesvirus 1 TaxID=10366 RepID=H2A369_MUHV1|nr:M54 protein [Murid betaherpesvirus 1]
MDTCVETFFNPYLRRKPRRDWRRCEDNNKNFLQVVPRGVLYDGATGLIKVQSGMEPRMFYAEKEYVLNPDKPWPTLRTRGWCRGPYSDELRFHTYDQVVNLVLADSDEQISPRWKHHVVPAGNVIRMFGATDEGVSVCVNVFGQKAYFYCEKMQSEDLKNTVYDIADKVPEPCSPFSVSISPVTKSSFYGYGLGHIPNLYRLSFNNWNMCRKIGKRMLEEGRKVYELGVDPLARFLIDRKIPSFGWCLARRYSVRAAGYVSRAQLEIDCDVADILPIEEQSNWPFYRCLSFDIECMSGTGAFPAAENVDDIIIQISCVCFGVGEMVHHAYDVHADLSTPAVPENHLFTIGPCAPIPDVKIYTFPSEYEMLRGFFIFLSWYSPEFITGYNINGFDIKYILTRAEKLYKMDVGQFTKLRRGGRMFVFSPEKGKAGFGTSNTVKVFWSGSIVLDMYPVCTAKASSPNYKLDTMAEIYLKKKKDDLSYKEIPVQFSAGDEGRARVGKYCLQDAVLVRELFEMLAFHFEAAAIARLARIPLRKVIFDGQQIRIYTCLLEECSGRDMILPNMPSLGHEAAAAAIEEAAAGGEGDETSEGENSNNSRTVGYQGATVLEPECGFHHVPVCVFDFASLYPSIIMSNNLCYSTLLVEGSPEVPEKDVLRVEIGDQCHRFVRENVHRSLLAELLVRWLTQRKLVREAMKQCTNEMQRMIMDKQQLALKVTCNAFYGFTGVAAGMLPCLPIAASITKIGRDMLLATAGHIEDRCNRPDFLRTVLGLPPEAIDPEALRVKIIYGDTDSVFAAFYGIDKEALLKAVGALAANVTNALFKEPVRLEFEKMFVSLMMICKKRYIGKVHGSQNLSMKGVDLVRRTACGFVKAVVSDVLHMVFNDETVSEGTMKLSRMTFDDLKKNGIPCEFGPVVSRLCRARDDLHLKKVPVPELTLSSVLSQELSCYKQKNLPHLAVIRRLAARKEELPAVGDRVEYVLTLPDGCKKNVPNYEIAEDPRHVVEAKLSINAEKYYEQVVKAVTNTLMPVFPRDMPKREKFFSLVVPQRIYIPDQFLHLCGNVNELARGGDDSDGGDSEKENMDTERSSSHEAMET